MTRISVNYCLAIKIRYRSKKEANLIDYTLIQMIPKEFLQNNFLILIMNNK
jgi:hypothetical protein